MAPVPDVDWTEKYRPRSLRDVVGNGTAVKTMQQWAEAWMVGPPDKRALVLEGTPGIGKTSAAHALAADMGWDLIELNASDARSAPVIQRVAGQGATTNTFSTDGSFKVHAEGGRTLIVLDEADNLFERGGQAASSGGSDLSDRGGKRAIVDTVRSTRQPIILIVNDYYGLTKGSGAALRSLTETVKFQRIQSRSIAKALGEICKAEGIKASPDAIMRIAENAAGDMRAAVNDLQASCRGREELRVTEVVQSGRDHSRGVWDALPDIFKNMDLDVARKATWGLDENPESFILWVDENLPHAYKPPGDLARGFDRLSRADVFLGRVRRRQYYGLWSYASELMTGGVAVAKSAPPRGWVKYQFPGWLRRMSSSKANRTLRDGLARKIGSHLHTSMRESRGIHLESMQRLFRADDEFAMHVGADLNLSVEELGLLLDSKPTTKRVKTLHDSIRDELEQRPKEHAGVWADDEADDEADDAVPVPAARSKKPAAEPKEPVVEEAAHEADDGAKPGDKAPSKGQKGLFDF